MLRPLPHFPKLSPRWFSYFPPCHISLLFCLFITVSMLPVWPFSNESIMAVAAPVIDGNQTNWTMPNNGSSSKRETPISASSLRKWEMPEIYIAFLYPASKEKIFGDTIQRTMMEMEEEFAEKTKLRLVTEKTAIPDTEVYTPDDVRHICEKWDRKPMIAVVMFAPLKRTFGQALASLHNRVPVLWASGQLQAGYMDRVPLSSFEVRLDGGCEQVLHALRSLLLASHWHSFTVMHTTNVLSSRKYQNILSQPPLLPSILPFRSDSTSHYIFGLLSDISKLTKGVIVLICNPTDAKRVLRESNKLNMVNGDFVWLWIDTSVSLVHYTATRKFYDNTADLIRTSRSVISSSSAKFEENYNNGSVVGARAGFQNRAYENRDHSEVNVGASNQNLGNRSNSVEQSRHSERLRGGWWILNRTGLEEFGKHRFLPPVHGSNSSSSKTVVKRRTSNSRSFSVRKRLSSFSSLSIVPTSFSLKTKGQPQAGTASTPARMSQFSDMPVGLLALQMIPPDIERRSYIRGVVKLLVDTMTQVMSQYDEEEGDNEEEVETEEEKRKDKEEEGRERGKKRRKKKKKKDGSGVGGNKLSTKILSLPRISCFDFHPVDHYASSITEHLAKSLTISVEEAMSGRWQKRRKKVKKMHPGNSTTEHETEPLDTRDLIINFKVLNSVKVHSRVREERFAHPEGFLKGNNGSTPTSKEEENQSKWRVIGRINGGGDVDLETIVWPGGDIIPVSTGRGSRSIFRVVTAIAPPFVMLGDLDEDGQCLRGVACHRFLTSDKDNLTLLVNEIERTDDEDEVNVFDRLQIEKIIGEDMKNHSGTMHGDKFTTNCCYGLSMDLLENVAEELEFDYQLYLVADGLFGDKIFTDDGEVKWNGIMGDLISGAAHMSFAPLSVSSHRVKEVDFSVPYFFSGVSFMAAPKESTDIPLMAFLLPFSPPLWIAIFTSLHVTAIAVAIYEWLSPFGLNPWGRQRSKNFGLASALWVMWGLLCGHLVQFKAPKSWPNKFLINVWGGFSVIFIASYTANIAALIAGLFFHNVVGDHHDTILLSQRVGVPKFSASEYYVKRSHQKLWDRIHRVTVDSMGDGVELLKNGSIDVLVGDIPILDYYRATDHGCKLQRIGNILNEDAYAVAMTKGFPLKDSISGVIAKYTTNGYIDILQEKWYGGLPCFKLVTDMAQPRPLGVEAVAGVFLVLGLGLVVGLLILCSEHLFYKYSLPALRRKPKTSIWHSRNVMFFSQKLYRFINCVELVSPHHAARELVHTLRQGQITSLFQKSVKRKENEQRQQHKNKAQFFEMIQEIRRAQREEYAKADDVCGNKISPGKRRYRRNPSVQQSSLLGQDLFLEDSRKLSPGRFDFARRFSRDIFRSRSSGNIDVNSLNAGISVAVGRFFDYRSSQSIGRRLSHSGAVIQNSPPDMNSRKASRLTIAVEQSLEEDKQEEEGENLENKLLTVQSPTSVRLVTNNSEQPMENMQSQCDESPRKFQQSQHLSPKPKGTSLTFSSLISRDIGKAAQKYTDTKVLSFKGKLTKKEKPTVPLLIVNNENHSMKDRNSDTMCQQEQRIQNQEQDKPESRNGSENGTWSTDHYIEIVIPSSTEEEDQREESVAVIEEHIVATSDNHRDGRKYRAHSVSEGVGYSIGTKPKITLRAAEECHESCNTWSSNSSNSLLPLLSKLSIEELMALYSAPREHLKKAVLDEITRKQQ